MSYYTVAGKIQRHLADETIPDDVKEQLNVLYRKLNLKNCDDINNEVDRLVEPQMNYLGKLLIMVVLLLLVFNFEKISF